MEEGAGPQKLSDKILMLFNSHSGGDMRVLW